MKRTTAHHLGLLFFVVVLALGATSACADQAADEAAIRKNAETYVAAYNKHDAKALAAMWSPDAVYLDPSTDETAVGREEIEKAFAETLVEFKDAKLEVTVESVEFVSPNVAIETGSTRIIRPNEEPEETGYTAVNVKRDGAWLLDRVTEASPSPPPPSNYEHLKQLEWMVGTWIDQAEDATVQIDCDWAKNQSFLHRSFAVVIGDKVDMSGMQIIGWDPIAKQIRSWVFDSDGGYSEGKWTHNGEHWQIEQTGVLPDGSKSSAVNVMTPIDNDSFSWASVSREVNGDLLPNVDATLIIRKPAE
jgi:uncharacterized protein (TIGR02246 family)